MARPSIGSTVKLFSIVLATKDVPQHVESRDATIIGFDPQPDEVTTLPKAHVAVLNPDKTLHLEGSAWSHAFDRIDSVPHADKDKFYYYELPKDETPELREFLLTNFKSETGDETPVACAIRLLGKKAKK